MSIVTLAVISLFSLAGCQAQVLNAGGNYTALVGGAALLRCQVQNAGVQALEWAFTNRLGTPVRVASTTNAQKTAPVVSQAYRNRAKINGTVAAGQFNLVIWNITAVDGGTYNCKLGSSGGDFNLYVIEPPRQLVISYDGKATPQLRRVPVDYDVTVVCRAVMHRPAAVIRWYKGGARLTPQDMIITNIRPERPIRDATGYYTISSTLRTKFRESEEGQYLTCATDQVDKRMTRMVRVTLGVGANTASKLLLGALFLLVRYH